MKVHKIEEIIKLFSLKVVADVKWKGLPVYGLAIGNGIIGIVFIMNKVEILAFGPDNKFTRLFRSEENRVNDNMDLKIILEYVLTGDEYRYVMKNYMNVKRNDSSKS